MFRVPSTALICVLSASLTLFAQSGTKNGEWRSYGGDTGSTRYSPLDQINAANFNKLQLAFRFKTENLGPRPEFQYQATPLMVNGRLFTTAGTRRAGLLVRRAPRAVRPWPDRARRPTAACPRWRTTRRSPSRECLRD